MQKPSSTVLTSGNVLKGGTVVTRDAVSSGRVVRSF